MPPKRPFDAELSALESLRAATPAEAESAITKALALRNNYLVAKAATLAQHHKLSGLAPALAEAFPRFLENAVKADPQCWAKNAIAKALAAFEYQDSAFFLTGMRHIQLEPVWGGSEDTAGTLRGVCALALVQCRELNSHRLLMHLTPLFADKQVSVQVNAARALEQIGTDSAALLLRLRAELASGEPELLGACYGGVLGIEGTPAIPWAAQFLPPEDDAAGEAAIAIAQTHTPEAFELLRERYPAIRDPWFRTVLLSAIALTRQQAAIDWLLDMIGRDAMYAADAHEALCRSGPSTATRERLAALSRPCN